MLKRTVSLIFLIIVCFMPFIWRVVQWGGTQPLGLISDAVVGLLVLLLVKNSHRWIRLTILIPWALFLIATFELVAAMQRFPSWQDVHYISDPTFLGNSISVFSLSSSGLAGLLLVAVLCSCMFPLQHRSLSCARIFPLVAILIVSYTLLSNRYSHQGVIGRYSPLHWLLVDTVASPCSSEISPRSIIVPSGLKTLDLDGVRLLAAGKAQNVLIVVLEGIPGLYYPEIAQAIGMVSKETEMNTLANSTPDAMLVPDFAVHSHQTIRGLYSMLCGDFSKLSWSTPKAFELQNSPDRAQDCLPAQMAMNGWSTHYLQGANLGFMSKDRVMPMIGFQHVRGNEWFSEANPYPFEWGVVDSVFFQGARKYIANLQTKQQPWMLTLLTVGTHQPYAVPDEIVDNYPSRKMASVALLDRALSEFIENLRRDKVLENTLVIVTSDESHGSDLANWISSWGLAVILAPEQLPRIKKGGFGLVDITASVLDYFGLQPPRTIIGRSFFRDYSNPREMISYTTSEHRWHTSDNQLYECADDGRCRAGEADSLLGEHSLQVIQDNPDKHDQLVALSAVLDNNLTANKGKNLLKFASGEIRNLPETITSEWADNLVGAQYIDFPENSQVHVSIKVRAIDAPTGGIALKLFLKQSDCPFEDIVPPEFPILYTGEEGKIEFNFNNQKARQSFSFHFVGEGKDAVIQLDEFDVSIEGEEKNETS